MTIDSTLASHLLRSRIGKICIAVTGSSPEEMIDKASAALKETSFIELRLDYLTRPAGALAALKDFLGVHGGVTAVATCRCEANGGRFRGSGRAALDILLQAAGSGFQIVDLELQSAEELPKDALDRIRATGAAVIISHHDFKTTKDLDKTYERIASFRPDFIKVVSTARSLSDNLTMISFLERMEDRSNGNLVGICMGEPGIISRVLGVRAGSAFTFAAANTGEETAPGQITARTLIETFRLDQVDKATKVYGVAGDPIRSSLSPLMMNAAFRRETVNSVYLGLQTAKAEDLFQLAREIPIQGLSITMPLKESVIPMLERTDPLSGKIGAVNTILRAQDGKFYGFNTDVAGIIGPLQRRLQLKGAKVLVLGAGGAARAAVFGCRDKGAEVWILNRTLETAQKLARQVGAKTIKREAVAKFGFDVIINATPVGMTGFKGSPLLTSEDLNARIVFDLVYNPLETELLRSARAKGIVVISGVEMFVQQGVRQFEIWTGKPAPEDDMLKVVLHALKQGMEPVSPASGEESAPRDKVLGENPAEEPRAANESQPAGRSKTKTALSKGASTSSSDSQTPAKRSGGAELKTTPKPASKATRAKTGTARSAKRAK